MVKKCSKQLSILMVMIMLVISCQVSVVDAAAKKVKLSASKITLKVNKSKKINVKNVSKKNIKKTTWKVTKGTKVIKLTKKSKTNVTVTGKKAGTATITATIKTKKKTYKKKVTVTVKKESTNKTTTTSTPATNNSTSKPTATPVKDYKEVIHYNMTTSKDGTTLLDQSGNKNDAELFNVDAEKKENDSLFLEKNGYISLPEKVFVGQDTLTISIWLKDYNGKANTSGMYVGVDDSTPTSYWLLNPRNLDGRVKCVMTQGKNSSAPWNTEVGISPSLASRGEKGPFTGTEWNQYVAVIEKDKMTTYMNGENIGTTELYDEFSSMGKDIVAYIGKSAYPDVTFNGFVREVQVCQTAKTDKEVKAYYEQTKGNTKKTTGSKSDIFIADRADPYIVKGNDGYYYFTASYPMYGSTDKDGYDRVVLRRSETLEGLKTAEEKVVLQQKTTGDTEMSSYRFVWAPEMHYIGGKWYLFYASSDSSSNVWGINCHVAMCTGDDPYNDKWIEKGKFQAAEGDNVSFTNFSLDMTYFECNNKSYVIWAQKVGLSNLYMAEIDPSEPWKLKTKPIMLTTPEYYWECVSIPVNEGPSVVIHDGKVIVAYSASATGTEYCLGFMYADANADLMNINSWTKQKTPALTSEDLVGEYGPGHNSFTVDEEGNTIFVYHSRDQKCYDGECGYGNGDPLYDPCRSARIRKVQWDENGLPILNR